ncbi:MULTISPECIES: NucA/NucB deoxyribonuclease domain-containing protein [Streptomyces]|uniref:NucA/NucB deoxyribonuclease domain-containing protein n=1 Tax=Streptomyces lycopersici TaxID=2974589 RepID=UPI0021D31158|nr:hypothetical protein [Streptomyces sp. NEAU-383]
MAMACAMVLACLLAPVASQAAEKPGRYPRQAPTTAAYSPQPGATTTGKTDTCKSEASKKQRARLAAAGAKRQACTRPSTAREAEQARPDTLKRTLAAQHSKGWVPIPDLCWDHAFDGWWVTRDKACKIESKTAEVWDLRTGRKVGEVYFLEINYGYTDSSESTWGNQMVVDKSGGWGRIEGAQVQGTASCHGKCKVVEGRFPTQTLSESKPASGDWLLDSTVGANKRGNGHNEPRYIITVPFAIPSFPVTDSTESIRCDDQLPGQGPGCVVPSYDPDWMVSRTGVWSNFARHVRAAQESGLPGAPDGKPLTRLMDKRDRIRNGDRACPQESNGGYPRPDGYSCDEYPFRSTHQGAYTQSPRAPAPGRTFNWCKISALGPGTGARGWSACMIPKRENSSAGRGLLDFYNENRILEKDKFHVGMSH